MSNVDVANNPTLLREESFLRMKGLEGLVDILQNMLRSALTYYSCFVLVLRELICRPPQPILRHEL